MSIDSTAVRPPARAQVRAFALAALAILGVAGCEATFRPTRVNAAFDEEDALVRAEVVPPDIWVYPRVAYGDSYAYLVGGVWYIPTRSGWMVLRREPVELSRERTRLDRRAPRAPEYGYPRSPPPDYGYPRRSP